MKIKTYEQWLDEQVEMLNQRRGVRGVQVTVDIMCPECRGDGVITDIGTITGREFEDDCLRCEGSGQIKLGDLKSVDEAKVSFSLGKYLKAVAIDLMALAEWQGKPAGHHLVDHGFAPHHRISLRTSTGSTSEGSRFVGRCPDTGLTFDIPAHDGQVKVVRKPILRRGDHKGGAS